MIENERKIVRTTIRMDGQLHERLSDNVHALKKLDRRKSLEWAVQEAVRVWLDGGKAAVVAPAPAPAPDRWHQMLAYILAAGDPDTVAGVQQNLALFYRLTGGRPDLLTSASKKRVG